MDLQKLQELNHLRARIQNVEGMLTFFKNADMASFFVQCPEIESELFHEIAPLIMEFKSSLLDKMQAHKEKLEIEFQNL